METNQDRPVSSLTLRLNSRKAFSDQWIFARIKDRRQDLGDGLLDQPVEDGRDSQGARASCWFWNLYPFYRQGL